MDEKKIETDEEYETALGLAVELTEEWQVKKRSGLSFIFENNAHGFVTVVVDALIEDDARIELAKCLYRSEYPYK